MITLDHFAVSAETLALAVDHAQAAMGAPLQPGGMHDVFHTHNQLMGLEDGLYLEAIAINPDAPTPNRPRWFDLDRFAGPPRLTNWICRTDDIEAALADLPAGMGRPVALQRGDLKWRMAVPDTGVLPFENCAPALIQWATDRHPATALAPTGLALDTFVVTHPQASEMSDIFGELLGDARIRFETGAKPGLFAKFTGPDGSIVLR